jgi:hypothetical protein
MSFGEQLARTFADVGDNRQRQLAAARPQLVLAAKPERSRQADSCSQDTGAGRPRPWPGLIVANAGSPAAVLSFAASVSVAALTATFASGIRTMRPPEEGPPT